MRTRLHTRMNMHTHACMHAITTHINKNVALARDRSMQMQSARVLHMELESFDRCTMYVSEARGRGVVFAISGSSRSGQSMLAWAIKHKFCPEAKPERKRCNRDKVERYFDSTHQFLLAYVEQDKWVVHAGSRSPRTSSMGRTASSIKAYWRLCAEKRTMNPSISSSSKATACSKRIFWSTNLTTWCGWTSHMISRGTAAYTIAKRKKGGRRRRRRTTSTSTFGQPI